MKKKATVLSLGSLFAALIFILIVTVPAFAAAPTVNDQTLSIAENKVTGDTTTPAKIAAFDPENDHNNNKLEFQKLSGDGVNVFDIGLNTGIVTLAPGQTLDYETKKTYTLNIRVQDTEALADEATITINVTNVSDVAPDIIPPKSFNIPENSNVDTFVGKVAITDADENDTHTYSITGGNSAGAFKIGSANGEIRVNSSAPLNFETTPQFNLTVKVVDAGGNFDEDTITINVTDQNEKPVIGNQTFNGLSEAAPNGTVVGTVAATDPDGDSLSFTRVSGSAAFAINANSGQVTVADNTLLDFETQPSPKFVVSVSDGKGQSATAEITVNLTDANDPPRVTGGGIPDVIINQGTLSATRSLWTYFQDDEDEDSALNFTIQNVDPATPSMFASPPSINTATGVLTLSFTANATGLATMTIRATDTTGAWVQDVFNVDINEAPVAKGYGNVTVNEDAPNYSINLYDGFTDAEQQANALVYSIPSGGVSNEPLFTSVTIALPNLILDFAPDASGQSNITVRATDSAGLWAETTFSVKVNPVNDPPTTSGIANVNVEEDAPDVVIELFKSFNDKEDDPKQLTYAVTENTNQNLFTAVSLNQGQSTLTLDFKPNTSGTAEITVQATDKGIPGVPNSSLSVSTKFTVTVGDVNDPPVVSNITKTIKEDAPYSFTLADFTSKYTDDDNDPLLNVRIESLPDKGTLRLDGVNVTVNQVITSGNLSKLVFTPALNWDEGTTSFAWNASDGETYAAAPAQVIFTVEALNDAPTIADVERSGDEGVNVIFTLLDFSSKFTDVDGDSLVKIRIESLPAHGSLRLGNENVTANQQINADQISNLRYVPDPFFFGQDSFGWSGSDGGLYSSPAQVILTIAPKNDAPTLDLNGNSPGTDFAATFVTGGPPVKIVGQGVNIEDIDDTMMEGATIIIVNRQHGTKEILDADTTGTNITKQFNAGGGVLTLAGSDTFENYEKVLRTITFMIESDVTNINTQVVRDVSVRVSDGELNSNDTYSKVTVINPRINVTVTPPIQTVLRGTQAIFYVTVENTGSVALQNIAVTSAKVPDCNRTFASLAVGQKLSTFACIASDVQGRIDNEVVVTAIEPQTSTQISDKDQAVARVLQNISIDIGPAPAVGDVLVKGQNAVFDVTVVNPSQGELTDVAVEAFVDYDLTALTANATAELVPAPECDKVIGSLGAGKETTYSCTIPNVQASFRIEVQVKGLIDGITPTEDFDIDEISVLSLNLEVFATPFQVSAGEPTQVEYSMTLSNISNVDLTLTALSSSLHGNLLDAANGNVSNNNCPALDKAILEGEVRTCSYSVTLTLQEGALTNVITANAGGDNKQLTVTDEALVTVGDFSPLVVVVGASPTSVVAPGGLVNLTVQVTNNTSAELTLDTLTDSIVGNLDGRGTCEIPRAIQGNGSYSCTYTVTISGKIAGDVVTHAVTAIADAKEASNSVSIPVTSSEQHKLHLPAVSQNAMAGEPNNGICSALQIATNQNYYFQADDANDWYRFTVGSAGSARIRLNNFLVTKGQLLVYSGDCSSPTRIGHNGDTGVVPSREIALTGLQPGGTYFIWVLSSEGLNPGSPYNLRVEVAGQ